VDGSQIMCMQRMRERRLGKMARHMVTKGFMEESSYKGVAGWVRYFPVRPKNK
jgi:hypothetical protein